MVQRSIIIVDVENSLPYNDVLNISQEPPNIMNVDVVVGDESNKTKK